MQKQYVSCMSSFVAVQSVISRENRIVSRDKDYMIREKLAQYLAGKKFIHKIMDNPADLSEFKERPTPRLIAGLILMVLSFIMGWPAVFALSFLAVWFQEPLIVVIGCPTTYVLSYVVFIVGAWMARAPHYLNTLTRYIMQSFLKKILPTTNNYFLLTDFSLSIILMFGGEPTTGRLINFKIEG